MWWLDKINDVNPQEQTKNSIAHSFKDEPFHTIQFFNQFKADFDHLADLGTQLYEIQQGNGTAMAYAIAVQTIAAGRGWSKPALLTMCHRSHSLDRAATIE